MAKFAMPIADNLLSKDFADCSYYGISEINNKEIAAEI